MADEANIITQCDSARQFNTSNYGLTNRQRDCLAFIRAEIDRTGVSPSYEEIMLHLGLRSKSGVSRLVHALQEKGHIQFLVARSRSLKVLDAPTPVADAIDRILSTCSLTTQTQAELRAIVEAEQ